MLELILDLQPQRRLLPALSALPLAVLAHTRPIVEPRYELLQVRNVCRCRPIDG